MDSFHDVVERLDERRVVLIFPEGGVHAKGGTEIQAFKSGVVLMAHKSHAPIIPLYVVRRKKWYHRQHIVIGQAIDVREALGVIPTVDKIAAVSDMLREKEVELRTYYETNYCKSSSNV